MTAIHLHRVRARYRLPRRAAMVRRRLDAILGTALHEVVEPAVDRLGIGDREHVCVRRLNVPVRLRLGMADGALAAAWGEQLAEAVRRAVAGENAVATDESPIEVVRYPSLAHALLDVVRGVARHDLRRAWAWRQVEAWRGCGDLPPADAVRELVRSLVRHPEWILPVLQASGEEGSLKVLAPRLEASHWRALAATALQQAGAPVEWRDLDESRPGTGPVRSVGSQRRQGRPDGVQPRAGQEAGVRWMQRGVVEGAEAEVAVAVLALLIHEPGSAALSREAWLERWEYWRSGPMRSAPTDEIAEDAVPVATRTDEPDEPAPQIPTTETAERTETSRDPRRRGTSAVGGAMLLLNLLQATRLPERLLREFPGRTLRWTLHQLAKRLTGQENSDPAVLAFAGLSPGSTPPDDDAPVAGAEEGAHLDVLMADLEAELVRREIPSDGATSVLQFVVQRSAEIVADPGWFEVRFPLSAVSTDLRRVGLDVNPGYLPWLGVVVTFVYE